MLRLLAAVMLLSVALAAPVAAATKVTVNGVAISDTEIAQRVLLMKLEGGGGTKQAMEQLIEDQLKLQEAKRFGVNISDAQVEEAFQNVARNVKLSTDKLNELLRANGISAQTMKERIRAALAWNQVVDVAVRARVQISDLDLDQQAAAALDSDSSFDYILKEVLFVAPGGNAAGRTAAANKYRSQFAGCDSAVQLSLGFTDAAVRDIGRRHATQLPDAIADELGKLNVGGITKPRVTETGVSMLAICEKNAARDLTFVKNKLRNEQGGKAMEAEAEKYLADMRQKARIDYN